MPSKTNSIAVEAFLLREGHTGVERYILNLVRTLAEGPSGPVTLFTLSTCRFDFDLTNPNLTQRVIPLRGLLPRILFQHLLFPFWLRRFDRVFFTGYLGSLLFPAKRTAVAIFDLIALEHPSLVRARTRWYYRALLPWFLARSRLLVVPSGKVRRAVLARRPRGRVRQMAIPVDEAFYRFADCIRPDLVGDCILTVGYGERKKNHRLLESIAPHFPDRSFLLAGKRVGNEEFPPNVRVLGFLPQDDLVLLYRRSRVLLFLSREEGYGLPVLEALVSGIPVLCWETEPFTELESPLLYHPARQDVASMVAKLEQLLEMPKPAPAPMPPIPRWPGYWADLERELGEC